MNDWLMLILFASLFGLSFFFIHGCDRIITVKKRTDIMDLVDGGLLVISFGTFLYLLYALLYPEKF